MAIGLTLAMYFEQHNWDPEALNLNFGSFSELSSLEIKT